MGYLRLKWSLYIVILKMTIGGRFFITDVTKQIYPGSTQIFTYCLLVITNYTRYYICAGSEWHYPCFINGVNNIFREKSKVFDRRYIYEFGDLHQTKYDSGASDSLYIYAE